ncbi:AraC family transcriptional regulator [Acinetobacter soli]|uniref:AraC family transcriptional regulator n=1 Tax=Acinetobacter soli TaxID=487316 RepID=UPI00125F0419|nr:AraC family transcriptional regulator [Acinetobacter soli]
MLSLSQEMDLNHSSHKAEFAHHLMSTICGEHRLDTTCKDTLNFHYEGMRLPYRKMALGKISYGANVAINTSQLRAYSISLPFEGKQTLNVRGETYFSNRDSGLIVSNAELQDLMIDKNCKKFQVVIPEQSLNSVLSELVKQQIDKPVLFNPDMHLENNPYIAAWWKNIETFLQLKSQYAGYGLQLWSEDYENFLIKSLLLSQENNYSERLRQQSYLQEPDYIRRVRHYLVEHAHEAISTDELHHLAGVSKSKLYEEFQHYYGMSPLVYLRKYRLQQVRKILTASAHKKVSISKLAYDWGFNHLGRFSQEYRDEFGESPSETRSKF